MRSSSDFDKVGVLIVAVSRLLRRNFDRRVQSLGLTQAQWRAIAHLMHEEGLNQAALAERLEVKPITVARLIDRMQSAGWVERRTDPDDRRAIRLYLTPKAQPILAEMQRRAEEMMAEALRGIAPSARRELAAALKRMKQNLIDAETDAAETRTTESKNVRRSASTGRGR
ncbi:MAG TPA: MarR family transcriptional regulator [Gammaproteobacteria bacterium]